MKIITNNVPRDFVCGYELTDAEKADFDYLDDIDSHDFFRYRGIVYDPSEFMHTDFAPDEIKAWDGFNTDTFFSGVAIRYTDDLEQIVVATIYA